MKKIVVADGSLVAIPNGNLGGYAVYKVGFKKGTTNLQYVSSHFDNSTLPYSITYVERGVRVVSSLAQ